MGGGWGARGREGGGSINITSSCTTYVSGKKLKIKEFLFYVSLLLEVKCEKQQEIPAKNK